MPAHAVIAPRRSNIGAANRVQGSAGSRATGATAIVGGARGVRRCCGFAAYDTRSVGGIILRVARRIRSVSRDLIGYEDGDTALYRLVIPLAQAVAVMTRIVVHPPRRRETRGGAPERPGPGPRRPVPGWRPRGALLRTAGVSPSGRHPPVDHAPAHSVALRAVRRSGRSSSAATGRGTPCLTPRAVAAGEDRSPGETSPASRSRSQAGYARHRGCTPQSRPA